MPRTTETSQSLPENECYIPMQDAADFAGVSVTHLMRLVKQGTLRIRKHKNETQAAWEDIKEYVRSQPPTGSLLTADQLHRDCVAEEMLNQDLKTRSRMTLDDLTVNRVVQGNCLVWLRQMPLRSVQTVITSPPYWGMRSYAGDQTTTWSDGMVCALGSERTPEDYVRHSAEILRAIRPILADNGTIWWNVGDTYQTRSAIRSSSHERLDAIEARVKQRTWKEFENKRYSSGHPYLKDKDLTLIPFQVAQAAQRLGYYVRSIIIWAKQNVGLDAAKDRPTPSHEYIILLAKARFYKYHNEFAQEKAVAGAIIRTENGREADLSETRKLRSVWSFPTSHSHGNHVAAFPLELPLRCIRISTDPGDLVFDPFMGSGTTGLAAKMLGRNYFGCDLAQEYLSEAVVRIENGESLETPPPERQTPRQGRLDEIVVPDNLIEFVQHIAALSFRQLRNNSGSDDEAGAASERELVEAEA